MNLQKSIDKIYKLSKQNIELLWKLSKYPEAYAICCFMNWFEKNRILHKRNSEADDIKFFALICLVIQTIETNNQKNILNAVNSFRGNEVLYNDLINCLEENPDIHINIRNIDNNLFNTFRQNGIVKSDKENIDKFSILKNQLTNANQIMLNLRNHYRATPMEEILRKVWRRLYWISKTIAIY